MTCRPARLQPNAQLSSKRKSNFSGKLLVHHAFSCVMGCFGLTRSRPMAQRSGRTANAPPAAVQYVRVDHGRTDIFVAQ